MREVAGHRPPAPEAPHRVGDRRFVFVDDEIAGPGRAFAGAEPDSLAEHLVQEQEAAVGIGEREPERQAVEQGVDMGVLILAARARDVVEQEEGGQGLGPVGGRDLDDPERRPRPCPRRRSGTDRRARRVSWSTKGAPSSGRASPSGPMVRAAKAGLAARMRPAASTIAAITPASPSRRPRFAGDILLRRAGQIGGRAALEPPQQMIAGAADVAAHWLSGQGQRRHKGLAVAAGGALEGGDRGALARRREPGGGRRAEPVEPTPAGADQRAVAVGQRQRAAGRGKIERGADQREIGGRCDRRVHGSGGAAQQGEGAARRRSGQRRTAQRTGDRRPPTR